MKYKDVSKAVRRIAKNTLALDDLASKVITKNGDVYHVYGKYTLTQEADSWIVEDKKIARYIFSSSKVALAWCIFSSKGQCLAADKLCLLDTKIIFKQIDIDFAVNRIAISQDPEYIQVLQARLAEDINTRQSLKKQLSKLTHSC